MVAGIATMWIEIKYFGKKLLAFIFSFVVEYIIGRML
jgi:hypothetical protein